LVKSFLFETRLASLANFATHTVYVGDIEIIRVWCTAHSGLW
jgi:hypothetical protein